MASLLDRIDDLLCLYGPFINNLNGSSLFTLAVASVSSLLYSLSQSQMPLFLNNRTVIQSLSFVYLISLALYIKYIRNKPQAHIIQYPILRTFFISFCYVTVLTLFVWCREPLRSVKNWYVPLICVSAYLHILLVLTILKQRETYGIPYCCLLVSATVVLPIAETNSQSFFVWLVAFLLFVVTNLQFQDSDSGVEETIHKNKANIDAKISHPQVSTTR